MAIATSTAILGAAALGTAGSVASGIMSGRAASRAADAQVAASDRQAETARYIFDTQRQDNQPLMGLRNNTLNVISGLRGYNTGGTSVPQQQVRPPRGGYQTGGGFGQIGPFSGINAQIGQDGAYMPTNAFATPYATAGQPQQGMSQSDAMQMFYDSPEYRMAFQGFEDQGDNYLASQAALGNLYSGGTMKRLSELERRNAFNAFGDFRGNLMQEAGLGQVGASSNQAAASQFGNTMNAAIGNAGAAQAQGYLNRASAYGNAFQGVANIGGWALGQASGGWA